MLAHQAPRGLQKQFLFAVCERCVLLYSATLEPDPELNVRSTRLDK